MENTREKEYDRVVKSVVGPGPVAFSVAFTDCKKHGPIHNTCCLLCVWESVSTPTADVVVGGF
jgi:hypothetical protein